MYQQRSVATVIILSILTCGIYAIYWYYVTMRDINEYLQISDMSPVVEIILMMVTFGIYYLYWMYKYGQRIADATEKAGLPRKDDAVLCLILSLFGLSIVSMGILQSNINSVYATIE